MSPLKKFLFARKLELLDKEKRALGLAKYAMAAQIQTIDAILQFLASQQSEEDMAKLRLTLEKQATPVDDIKPRQNNLELTEALIELADELEQAWKKDKSGKDLKFPLNALPDDIKIKSVSSKIYGLRKMGKLPANILPSTRTADWCEKCQRTLKFEDMEKGKCVKCGGPVTEKEFLYMKWVKNPPAVEVDQEN